MPSFRQRSYQKELLDRDDIPFDAIRRNMEELDIINHRLGGHKITLDGLRSLLPEHAGKELHVVEIGCGGGDNLRVLKQWSERKQESLRFTGIDINPNCIGFARGLSKNEGIEFICSDYRDVRLKRPADIIFSSLFCHHFTDEELASQLTWMRSNSRLGFFINDLHRHALAYYSILALTRMFSNSYLVKNDAPLSVRRGFRKEDWKKLFALSGIDNFNCRWKWAFRWLIVYRHGS